MRWIEAPGPSPREAGVQRRGKRTEILDAALEVTAKTGLAAASLAEVAARAKVSKALIVYHFGGVAGLRREMTVRAAERFEGVALGAAIRKQGSLEERGLAALDSIFEPENRSLLLAMHELLSIAPREPEVAAAVRHYEEPIRKLVAALVGGQDDPRVLRAGAQVTAAVHGCISLWIWSGAGDPKPWRDAAEDVARSLLSRFDSRNGAH